MRYILSTISFLLFLTACSSHVPELIRQTPEPELNYVDIKDHPETSNGHVVRWGGDIVSVENRADTTLIEILSRDLDYSGRPIKNDIYQGRFIARVSGFLDPALYSTDRSMTVHGRIDGKLEKNIEEHPYQYPVVDVDEHYLWPEYHAFRDMRLQYDPFFYRSSFYWRHHYRQYLRHPAYFYSY